jgi:hypothetical protein
VFSSESNDQRIAFLGLVDKYNTLAGLVAATKTTDTTWNVKIKCSGLFAIWTNTPSKLSLEVDGRVVPAKTENTFHDGAVLLFDLDGLLDRRSSEEPFNGILRLD